MTDPRAWLRARRPSPPEGLAARLQPDGTSSARLHEILADAGLDALDLARSTPGGLRESAFHLLTADALLTYACEAALEEADPEPELEGILRRAAVPDRG